MVVHLPRVKQNTWFCQTKSCHLLQDDGLTVVKGLNVRLANNEEEALNLLFEGETNRVIAEHALNHASSRSHCVFTVHIEVIYFAVSSSLFTIC